jgi:hypothetical protein
MLKEAHRIYTTYVYVDEAFYEYRTLEVFENARANGCEERSVGTHIHFKQRCKRGLPRASQSG